MAEPSAAAAADTPTLDFERPVVALERKIDELVRVSGGASELRPQIALLEARARELQQKIFSELTPWQKVQLSRHPARPYTLDYIERLFEGFIELHGDRRFADDPAVVGGFGTFDGMPVLVLGHQKGRSTKEKVLRNFGQPKPEGYRKALRLMELAARTRRPIICLIDTQGAYPILRQEYATYSVIWPEGCASILWRDDGRKPEAAAAMKITATDLQRLGVVDEVVPEAPGGAHRDHDASAKILGEALRRHLKELYYLKPEELRADRYKKFRHMGAFVESGDKGK